MSHLIAAHRCVGNGERLHDTCSVYPNTSSRAIVTIPVSDEWLAHVNDRLQCSLAICRLVGAYAAQFFAEVLAHHGNLTPFSATMRVHNGRLEEPLHEQLPESV